MRIFAGFLDIEGADRLTPFKTEMPKSRENTRFWAGSDYTRHPKVIPARVYVLLKVKLKDKHKFGGIFLPV